MSARLWRCAGAMAVALVAAGLLSGCVTAFVGSDDDISVSTPAPQRVDTDLEPFYTQELVWEPCDDGLDCAWAYVPRNWDSIGPAEVSISLVRHRAEDGASRGTLFVNPGGPGASGTALVRDGLDAVASERLQREFDIVGFDPRGVAESAPVICYYGDDMDEYLYGVSEFERGSNAWIAEQTKAASAFASECQAWSGGALSEINTEFAARDLDVLRATVGDETLSYLGFSYGTFLGATYADLFPERVGRLALDAAIDPSTSSFDVVRTQAGGFESALDAYLNDCIGTDGCPFTGTVADARDRISAALTSADENPLRAADGRLANANTLLTAIIFPLYSESSWPALSEMLTAAFDGDAEPVFQLADTYNGRDPDGEWSSNTTNAFTAYNCADYPVNTDTDIMREQAEQLADESPVFGPYMGFGDLTCASWPITEGADRTELHAEGAAPILVVGTTNDPATPYAWSVALSEQLESGVLVTNVGEGHTAYNGSNPCVTEVVDDYLINGVVPDADPRC